MEISRDEAGPTVEVMVYDFGAITRRLSIDRSTPVRFLTPSCSKGSYTEAPVIDVNERGVLRGLATLYLSARTRDGIFWRDKHCQGDDRRPLAFFPHSGLGNIQRLDDLSPHLEDLFTFFPGDIGIKLHS